MIETERLLLRQWREADREPWAALNADPQVMEHFPAPLTREESDASIDRNAASLAAEGFGNWAVERRSDGAFLGHVGLKRTGADLPFGGAPEMGWRLAFHAWGQGYASEAARAALTYGFDRCGLGEVVAFTAVPNLRSQAVMARIGLERRADLDFDHPALPKGHRLERHVVYALTREPRASAAPSSP